MIRVTDEMVEMAARAYIEPEFYEGTGRVDYDRLDDSAQAELKWRIGNALRVGIATAEMTV
jgi:hypothetical protein